MLWLGWAGVAAAFCLLLTNSSAWATLRLHQPVRVQVWCKEPPRAPLPLPQELGHFGGGAPTAHPGTATSPGEHPAVVVCRRF
jgi:hypothetical protein